MKGLAMTDTLTFGKRYAVLNLDLMSGLLDIVRNEDAGQHFISSCCRWNDAMHAKRPKPLTIFTSLAFRVNEPELAGGAPFTKLLEGFGSFANNSPRVQVVPGLAVDEQDILLQKVRLYAGSGNALETILKAQKIDTVFISGLSLAGVVLSTIYRLYDLDYKIYIIKDNVLELPLDQHQSVFAVVDLLLRKLNVLVMTLEEALQALEAS